MELLFEIGTEELTAAALPGFWFRPSTSTTLLQFA